MSQSLTDLPGVVEYVLNDIVEALTHRRQVSDARRDTVTRMIRGMVLGLCPRDVMQLMMAGKAVLFYALTIDAARDVPHDDVGSLKFRAQSAMAALGRTMTRSLEMLTRLQVRATKEPRVPGSGRTAPEPTANIRIDEMLSQLFMSEAALETPKPPVADTRPAPLKHLNRQQRRQWEREQARLARRMPAGQPAMKEGRQ